MKLIEKVRLINELNAWFDEYDAALSQFQRKKALYEQGLLESEEYSLEFSKILDLHLIAEKKAAKLKDLRNS